MKKPQKLNAVMSRYVTGVITGRNTLGTSAAATPNPGGKASNNMTNNSNLKKRYAGRGR